MSKKKEDQDRTVFFCFSAPAYLGKRLREEADRQRRSLSRIVVDALLIYLARPEDRRYDDLCKVCAAYIGTKEAEEEA